MGFFKKGDRVKLTPDCLEQFKTARGRKPIVPDREKRGTVVGRAGAPPALGICVKWDGLKTIACIAERFLEAECE